MPVEEGRLGQNRFPLRLFAAAFAISMLVAAVGGGLSWQLNHRFDKAQAREFQLNEYIGQVRLFDEVLTMSARMAAATGDFSYEQRYDKYDAELDALIKKTASALGLPEVRQFVEQTDEANRRLVEMERRAFALASEGRRTEATALLVSDEYLKWKAVYADGVEKTVAWQRGAIESEQRDLRFLTVGFEISSSAVILALLSTWYFVLRTGRRWSQERLRSEATLRKAHDELELRVRERTADLQIANETLRHRTEALTREVEERKRGEAALQESRQIISAILNTVPARIFWKDKNLVYLGCNAAFARDAGFAHPEDIVGKDDYQMGWRDQANLYRGDDRQVIESGHDKLLIEEPQTTPEGKGITLLTNKAALRSSDGEIVGVLGTYMDITERKSAEAALQRRDALLHAAATAATELVTAATLDDAIPKALKMVGGTIQIDRIAVLDRPPTPDAAPILRYVWQAADINVILDQRFFESPALMTPQIAAWHSPLSKGRIVTADLRTATSDVKRMLENLGTKSLLVVPVSIDGKYWGQVGFESCKSEREWPAFEIEILQSLADLIGNAIRRERYVNEITDANRIVQNTPTILYRVRGEPSLPMIYVSQNIKLLGHDPAALIASPHLYRSLIHPDDVATVSDIMAHLLDKDSHRGSFEFRMMTGHGDYRWVENRYTPIRDDAGRLIEIEGLLYDITERKAAEQKISRLARTDPLTGLANRATFIERLQNTFAAARRGAMGFAVLYLDLDRFKDINDTLGHPVGDRLLIGVGKRLKSSVRETDVVARIGGDEFAVLQADLNNTADAGTLAVKIRAAVAEPIQIAGNELRITASIGISIYASDIVMPEDMLAQADVALYRAKEEGRDQYRFHTQELDTQVREQVAISDELHLAVDRGEFEVYYQPQVELSTSQIVGMEALIRWNHPKRGLLTPAAFIEAAERTGAIAAIGQWVLDRACQQMSLWRAAGIAPPTIAVNISPVQIKTANEFVELVTKTLAKWHLAPADLELDVTESMLARATLAQNDVLERLQKIGVKISIDDFGTKYSSLDYLKTYRVNRLKIPQPLIDSATRDPDSAAMVRAIVGIARELNIEVIAQGVETEAQWSFLTATSPVTKVQGYYYSEPVPAERAAELLRRGRIAPAEDKHTLLAVDLAPV